MQDFTNGQNDRRGHPSCVVKLNYQLPTVQKLTEHCYQQTFIKIKNAHENKYFEIIRLISYSNLETHLTIEIHAVIRKIIDNRDK